MRNEDFDPIMALYDDAAACARLPESTVRKRSASASLLSMVADDVADCAAMLDDTEGKVWSKLHKNIDGMEKTP